MPSKNIVREFAPRSYYHIYNRGVEKRVIYIDDEDYTYFVNLLKRHLSKEKYYDKNGRAYRNYYGEVELVAYCLMPNHFHFLLYISENERAYSSFLQGILTAYTIYFNKKYKRVGGLFQSTFKASRISNDRYLQHVSRYIHLNPRDYKNWEYSSWPYFTKGWEADWINPKRLLDIFDGDDYEEFVADYESNKDMLDKIKRELADH